MTDFPCEDVTDTNLPTLGIGLMTEYSKDITKIQLGEPISFTEVTYRNVGEGYLWEQKAILFARASTHPLPVTPET